MPAGEVEVMVSDIQPKIDEKGVPWCTERCPKFDGKRCEALGCRPGPICEPGVVQLVKRAKVVTKLAEAIAERAGYFAPFNGHYVTQEIARFVRTGKWSDDPQSKEKP